MTLDLRLGYNLRAMIRAIRWRIASDYIGAGSFLVSSDRLVVGTAYGVQCLPRGTSPVAWRADLGSRCIGVAEGADGSIFAACLEGLHVLSRDGRDRWGAHSLREVVYGPVPYQGGILLTTREALHYLREGHSSEWRFDFDEVLDDGAARTRVVNLFGMDPHIVVGVIDGESGIGRVIVLQGRNGRRAWTSEPGPLSEVFPGGPGVFVWCQVGQGRLETRMTRLDGYEIWQRDAAGLGCARADGSVAILAGPPDAPGPDQWEYRQFSQGGKSERSFRGDGRCCSRPLCLSDGTVYFMVDVPSPDETGSAEPRPAPGPISRESVFRHVMGTRILRPEGEIRLHRLLPDAEASEVIYRNSSTFSLADLQATGGEVIFCDGSDVLAVTP